ncbi:MAG TPA: GTP cyclohydrolase I [Candidatus Limnocylindrales bacterium]|nr:GTP cyclohydrolase I [Candidatus Limnocylindrales bacterium]
MTPATALQHVAHSHEHEGPHPIPAAEAVTPGARADHLALAPRHLSVADRVRFERNLGEILGALGLDLDTPGTRDTPRRLLAALIDSTGGYDGDPKLVTSFPTECHGGASCELAQIVEGPIPFFALCEHHALPFFGQAWLGYVAHEEILGISKLTRLVRVLTRRFGVQERMTHQLAESLESLTSAHGVAVYLEAEHLCTQMRGVREHGSRTRTTAYRGVYERNPSLRSEFRDIAGIGRGQ